MGNKFKYVIINELYPRVCSEAEAHSDLARGMKVTSAGFGKIYFNKETGRNEVNCYGESISLKVKSDPKVDSRLLSILFN